MARTRKTADEALLRALACGATVENAARTAGISARTAHRRLKEEAFQKRESFGMSGMRERVALLGGKFLAESRVEGPKRGTKISIELPIAK